MFNVLVGVDLQNSFINGELGTPEAQAIIPRVVEKIRNVDRDTLILLTKDTHGEDYFDTLEGKMLPVKHCIEGTHGWSIHQDVSHAADYDVKGLRYSSSDIIKSRILKNTFGSDKLEEILVRYKDEIEMVEFCGLCTDICVISNVLMARQKLPNTRIVVDASCCAGVTPEKHRAALEVMKSCQIEIINE